MKHRATSSKGLGALEVSTGSTIAKVARAFDRVAAGVREQAAAFGEGPPRAELVSPLDGAQAQLYAAAIASSNHAFSVYFDGMISAWNRRHGTRRARAPLTDSSAAIDALVMMLRMRLRTDGVHPTEH